MIKDDIWPNPMQYYLSPDVEAVDEDAGDEEDGDLDEEALDGNDQLGE